MLKEKIYITGGITNSGASNKVYEFDPSANTVIERTESALQKARYWHGISEHKGKLYVFGGTNGIEELDTIEVLDL